MESGCQMRFPSGFFRLFSDCIFVILICTKFGPAWDEYRLETGELKLRMPKLIRVKRTARIIIAVLCVFALSAACAEVKQDITEANGKVTQIEWKNDEGKIVPGPAGYA